MRPRRVSLVLDAGALLAIDRRDRKMGALLRVAQQERIPLRTSPAAVAQVWRHGARQAQLARTLAGMAVPSLDLDTGRIVYVDNAPLVLVHARALLTSTREGVTDYIDVDLRNPDRILQEAARTLDFTQPIGRAATVAVPR